MRHPRRLGLLAITWLVGCATLDAPAPATAAPAAAVEPTRGIARVSVRVLEPDGAATIDGRVELWVAGQRAPVAVDELSPQGRGSMTIDRRGFARVRLHTGDTTWPDVAIDLAGRPVDLTVHLPAEGPTPTVEFRRPQSTAARVALVVGAMQEQRARNHDRLSEEDEVDMELVSWRTMLARVASRTDEVAAVRDAARVALIGLLVLEPIDDVQLRRQAFKAIAEVDPADPVWSIDPAALTRALSTVGPTEAAIEYAQRAIVEQPDDDVVATLLRWRLEQARAVGDDEAARATAQWLAQPRFADTAVTVQPRQPRR